MAPNTKRVFYVKYVSSPLFDADPGAAAGRAARPAGERKPDDIVTPILDQAHVYQIGASRQVIAPHFQVAERCWTHAQPGRGVVERRRLRHRSMSMPARAQGIAVVNQSGGNKEGVAEHALAMMLTLSKRIIETDRRMRAGPEHPAQPVYRPRVAEPHRRRHRHRQCRRPRRRAVPRLVQDARAGLRPVSHRRADQGARGGEGGAGRTAAQADFVSVHCPLTREIARHDGARRSSR